MSKNIIGKPTKLYTFIFAIIFYVTFLFTVYHLLSNFLNVFGPSGNIFWKLFIFAFTLILSIIVFWYPKANFPIVIHENLHAMMAANYNYQVEIIIYKTLRERKVHKCNGFCKFRNGEYLKKNIKKIYLAPFIFSISAYIICILFSFNEITNPLFKLIADYLALANLFQIHGCISDVKGFLDIQWSDSSIKTVIFEDDHFYFNH